MRDDLINYLKINHIRNPQWLSETEFVFSYNKSGTPQVWMADSTSDTISQLSHYTDFITSIVTDPLNERYAFMMADGGNERSQIFSGSKDGLINLTNQPDAVHMLGAYIPNTQKLLFTSNLRNSENFDLETIDIVTGERHLVLANDDNYNFIDSVSPDGRYYIYRKLISESNQPLWCFDTHSKRAFQIRTSSNDAKYSDSLWLDDTLYFLTNDNSEFVYCVKYDINTKIHERVLYYEWDIESISLSHKNEYLACIVNEDGYRSLYVYELLTMKRVNVPLPPKGSITFYDKVVWAPSTNKLLFTFSSGVHLQNIWLLDLETDSVRRITNNVFEGEHTPFVEPQLCRFTSFDGLSVPYWLYVPHGVKPVNLPVLIEIHGGPEGQQGSDFDELIAYILSQGIAVVAPNIRGSTGYGKTYTHLDDVEKRLDSVKDIEYLVNHLVDKKIASKNKIAVSGTSYGGFMTLSCAARLPHLFCAAVDTVGMYNLVTFLERTAPYRRAHRESEYGSLENNRQLLFDVSPVKMVDNIRGPLMIIHGTNDPRVPVYEAQQVVDYLEEKGVEIHFLEYKDEGHGIQKLSNRLDCYPKVIQFLKEKMADKPIE